MDKEQKFKDSINNNLNNTLKALGYKRTLVQKGLVEFTGINNILTFVFEWNQDYGLYCQLKFDGELMDYPLQFVTNRLKGLSDFTTPDFGQDFNELVDNWTRNLSIELPELSINSLTIKSEVIQKLKQEFEKRNDEYNLKLELDGLRQQADIAWNSQNFKQFIALMSNRAAEFPDSYSKKLSIAKKRI
ncbi:MAG: hypothetical protein ACJARP_003300 [Vicingaceae bacterium]|jgi:hypothetical protein